MDRRKIAEVQLGQGAGPGPHRFPRPQLLGGRSPIQFARAGGPLNVDGQGLVDERVGADQHRDALGGWVLILPR